MDVNCLTHLRHFVETYEHRVWFYVESTSPNIFMIAEYLIATGAAAAREKQAQPAPRS